MVNPCCMPLQRGTIILAIIDAVLNGILLALMTLAFVGAILLDPNDPKYEVTQSQKVQLIVFCVFSILIAICQIALAMYLRRSAKDNNYHGCKKWLVITVILFAIAIVSIAVRISAGANATDIASSIIGILYRLYVMFVVYCFLKELDNNGISHYNGGGGGP